VQEGTDPSTSHREDAYREEKVYANSIRYGANAGSSSRYPTKEEVFARSKGYHNITIDREKKDCDEAIAYLFEGYDSSTSYVKDERRKKEILASGIYYNKNASQSERKAAEAKVSQ
tara:strand:- start:392 stop:739 length:348 start_codon:yes stop_codon:yes gene_type:complete